MSIRARLQISITVLVGVIVVVLSALYLASTIERRFSNAGRIAAINAQQVQSFISQLTASRLAAAEQAPATIDEAIDAYVEIVELEPEVSELLKSLLGSSEFVVEGLVTGPTGRILAASIDARQGQPHSPGPLFEEFEAKGVLAKLSEVFGANQDYEVVSELGLEGRRTIFTIRMILSTALVREEIGPEVDRLMGVSVAALFVSLLAAAFVSRLAVKPFERIGDMIDRIASGEVSEDLSVSRADGKEVAAVESKLSLLGEQFRGARDDADQLRGDIGQLLARLEEAVLLFGRDERLVMAGGAADRLLPGGRWGSIGRTIDEVFPDSSSIGALIQGAVRFRKQVKDQPSEIVGPDGEPLRVLVSVEVSEEFGGNQMAGALVTLRDAAPRREIRSQLDVSTRMAAISRLTSGAAHEIKNPLNAIALHLEILKSKLEEQEVGQAEIEVISREIRRLDRVVKSFLDFTRPVELKTQELDLAQLLGELVDLTAPDAVASGVRVRLKNAPAEAVARVDRDLMQQALLNVMVNGIQAMAEKGGDLDVELEPAGDAWLIRIRDEGAGIPDEIRDQIYQLYFTTKGKGSGIGLAMAFQIVQLHGGTIEFASAVGEGTEFRIEIPAIEAEAEHGEAPTEAVAQPAESG